MVKLDIYTRGLWAIICFHFKMLAETFLSLPASIIHTGGGTLPLPTLPSFTWQVFYPFLFLWYLVAFDFLVAKIITPFYLSSHNKCVGLLAICSVLCFFLTLGAICYQCLWCSPMLLPLMLFTHPASILQAPVQYKWVVCGVAWFVLWTAWLPLLVYHHAYRVMSAWISTFYGSSFRNYSFI